MTDRERLRQDFPNIGLYNKASVCLACLQWLPREILLRATRQTEAKNHINLQILVAKVMNKEHFSPQKNFASLANFCISHKSILPLRVNLG